MRGQESNVTEVHISHPSDLVGSAVNAVDQYLRSNDPNLLKRAQVGIETLEVVNRTVRNEQAARQQSWTMVRAITNDPEAIRAYVTATEPTTARALPPGQARSGAALHGEAAQGEAS